jgi:hypothetical protein
VDAGITALFALGRYLPGASEAGRSAQARRDEALWPLSNDFMKSNNKKTMNRSTTSFYTLRAATFGLLALTLAGAVVVLRAEDKTTAAAASSQLAKDLIGTWVLVGKPGEVGEAPAAGGRLKFFTGRHWTITQADPKTGVTIFHHGGTYALKGNEYHETVEYANESTTNLISQTFKFTIKVEADSFTQTGVGNPWTEVWKRAK